MKSICGAALAISMFITPCIAAQSPAQNRQTLMLVLPAGRGGIPLPDGDGWEPQSLSLTDGSRRVIAQVKRGDVNVSYILESTGYKNITAAACRNDTIASIERNFGDSIKHRKDSESRNATNQAIATTEYFLEVPQAKDAFAPNLFGFIAFDGNCAEVHVSQIARSLPDMEPLRHLVSSFSLDTTYEPTFTDYMRMASVMFKQQPDSAVPYYRAASLVIPHGENEKLFRRLVTDQLAMALGMSGDLQGSRKVSEEAIKTDPEYPMNYYMLACGDAEKGDAAGAKANLQMAWERRGNMLPGEKFPNPSTDDSLLKLKKNKEFWAYVVSLNEKS